MNKSEEIVGLKPAPSTGYLDCIQRVTSLETSHGNDGFCKVYHTRTVQVFVPVLHTV